MVHFAQLANWGQVRMSGVSCDQAVIDTLRLALLPGIGPRTMTLLLDRFGDAAAVLSADRDELAAVAGVGPKLVHAIRTADHFVDADGVLSWCEQNDVRIVPQSDDDYPSLLHQIDDPPSVLFQQGEILPADELAVGIVGTRHASHYGLKQAEHFAFMLAKAGVTVISGLARGIDAAAHQGAIHGNGRTIAVLGGGLGQIYPSEHRPLAGQITTCGAVISEYAPQAKPRGGMFPQRNRIISGMSMAVLVVEAPQRSGSLITARLAMEQGREVLAIPGPINSRTSRGCNLLIRDGAKLVQNIDDVLEEIGPLTRPINANDGHQVHRGAELTLNEVERSVLDAIDAAGSLIDTVIAETELPASRVLSAITVLEVKHLLKRKDGGRVFRV